MPNLTVVQGRSSSTASICCRTISGSIPCMALTSQVFCAVMAVIADVPNTPMADMVFKSACIPAPPLLSEPAIVNTTG